MRFGAVTVIFAISLFFKPAVYALDSGHKKVVVGALTELQDVEPQLPNFQYDALVSFIEQYKLSHPSTVIKALVDSLNQSHQFTVSQQFELAVELAQLYGISKRFDNAILTLQSLYVLHSKLSAQQAYQLEYELSVLYRSYGNFHSAVDSATAAYQIASKNNNDLQQVLSAKHLADVYAEIEQWAVASHWITVAKHASVDWQNVANLIWMYLEKSLWHQNKGELYLATQAVKRAISVAQDEGLAQVAFSSQLRLAELYRLQYQTAHAEPLLQTLFESAQASRDRSQQFWVLHEIIELQISQLKFTDANAYFDASKKLRRFVYLSEIEAQQLNANMQWQKSRIMSGLGKHAVALKALRLAEADIDDLALLKAKARLLAKLGETEKAHRAYAVFEEVQSNIRLKRVNNINNYLYSVAQQQILDLNQNLQTLQQVIGDKRKQLDNSKQTITWLVVILVGVLHLGGFLFLYRRYAPHVRLMSLYKDKLTTCWNARYLDEQVQIKVKNQQAFSLVMFDLDNFAEFNDRTSYQQGDRILMQLAQSVKGLMFNNSELIRYNGDCFCILADGFSEQQAYVLAQRVRFELNKLAAQIQSKSLVISASSAVVTSDHNHSVEKLLSAAKLALSVAKKQGKDRTEIVYLD